MTQVTRELIELAERVEKAEGADRELDRLIRDTVFQPCMNNGAEYTGSIDAAMRLVPEGLFPTIDFVTCRTWLRDAKGFDVQNGPAHGFGKTVPNSIVAAALRARSAATL